MKSVIAVALLALVCPTVAAADEPFVYESFAGVKVGRVFLSQSQRDALDAVRLLEPGEGVAEGSDTDDAEAQAQSRTIRPAGYIIGSSGRSRVWKDGDFVETSADVSSATAFPGTIRITRHRGNTPQADSTGAADGGDDGAE